MKDEEESKEPKSFFSIQVKSTYFDLQWSDFQKLTEWIFTTIPGFVRIDKLHLLHVEDNGTDIGISIEHDFDAKQIHFPKNY